jgi:lipopolysaccharide transport system permease protein
MSLMLVFSVIFSKIIVIPTDGIPYPLFSYAAVLPWTFFSSTIAAGVPSLVNNKNLVTKVRMPREIIPIAFLLAGLFDFLIAAALFVCMLFYYKVPVYWTWLWIVPLLGIQIILTLAIVFIGSALLVLYRDIRFVVPLVTQLWMYADYISSRVDSSAIRVCLLPESDGTNH